MCRCAKSAYEIYVVTEVIIRNLAIKHVIFLIGTIREATV